MLSSQLDYIRSKIRERIYDYEQGNIGFPLDCFDENNKLIKEEVEKFIKSRAESLEGQFKIVHYFYNNHEEEPPTREECREGEKYLKQYKVSEFMIKIFIKSYNNIPVEMFSYAFPSFDYMEDEIKPKFVKQFF